MMKEVHKGVLKTKYPGLTTQQISIGRVTGERLAHLCNEIYRSRSTSHVGTEIRCRNEQLMQT